MMKKYLKKIVIVFTVLILIVVIGYLFLSNPEKGKEKEKEKYSINIENNAVVFPVKIMKLEKRQFIRLIKSSGVIRSNQEAEIYPQMSGRILKSNIREGSIISKNSVLLELDDREYKIALSKANNELTKAQFEYLVLKASSGEMNNSKTTEKISELFENYKKALEKYEKGIIDFDEYLKSRNEYELSILSTGVKKDTALQSRSGLLSAINELKRAELNYSYTKIRAPFSGVIADYDLSVGGTVSASKPVCKLVDISRLRVITGVLESEVKMLNIGRSVDIYIPALGEQSVKGKIVAISPVIDPEKKTCKTEIEIISASSPLHSKIKPGMFANCVIEGEILPDKLLIPKKSLLVRNDRRLVFTVSNERDQSSDSQLKAQWVYVKTGVENEEWIEIIEGLNVGDQLIIDGHYTLSHNAVVRVE